MARKREELARSGRTILVVDDDPEYLEASRRVVERDGHTALTANSAREGLDVLRARDVDLVLVDYLMPSMTGEAFVAEMRSFRPTTQVVLQTGYASEHPPRELLRRMDIQGFHDKSDGPAKLSLWIDVGLKTAAATQLLVQSRLGLRYVLDATPPLHRIQPLDDLLQGILLQTAALVGAANGFLATGPCEPGQGAPPDGFVALAQDEGGLCLRAATGRFQAAARIEESLDAGDVARALAALARPGITTLGGSTIAPLRVGARTVGLVYLERAVSAPWQTELVEVFANQAAVAIHNVTLYEMAALDALTGVSTRRFFEKAVLRELRGVSRTEAPAGLLMVDVDRMKTLNDEHGHVAGDRALAAVGAALRGATRTTDIVGRYGGDELAVFLPATEAEGTATVAQRVRDALSSLSIEHEGQRISVSASVGAAVLDSRGLKSIAVPSRIAAYLDAMKRRLFAAADEAMYARKRGVLAAGDASVTAVGWAEVMSAPLGEPDNR